MKKIITLGMVTLMAIWTGICTAQTDWVKYSCDPVLNPGDPGDWDDEGVRLPYVIKDGIVYKMWYSGRSDASTDSGCQIGYATSPDGINWTKYENNPVLDLGGSGEWDDDRVYVSTVLKEGPDDYKMWYSGGHEEEGSRVGYATSPDGINWTKYVGNPVINSGDPGQWDDLSVDVCSVMKEENIYKVWYQGRNDTDSRYQIGYATSPDGTNWTKYGNNPVINPGNPGQWDDLSVGGPMVIKDGTIYKMWYIGCSTISLWRIGYATSPDGINWTKYVGNPVINPGSPECFDSVSAEHCTVIMDGDIYKMWYEGKNSSYQYRIGYASSEPSNIPTLTEWGIIIFMTVMIGIGVVVLRRRRMS